MSYLLASAKEPQPRTKQARGRGDDGDQPATNASSSTQNMAVSDRLLTQLEARVRAVEKDLVASMVMAQEHPIARGCSNAYQAYLKDAQDKDENKHPSGGP